MTIQKLNKKISACKKCRLHKTRTNTVPGIGNTNADLFFIGEAPGKNEDGQGVPFVGMSGKILDDLLGSINLAREDVYIANVVKCRPPKNQDPKSDEMTACWPYLEEQISIIKPKIIITLGRHSMYRFLPKKLKLSDSHGKVFDTKICDQGKVQKIFPIYHPAATLYNRKLLTVLKKDFLKISRILKKKG